MIDEKSLTPSDIRKLQTRLLRETVGYCKTHSPFYRKQLAGIDPRDITDIDDVVRLPFTSKDDLSSASESFQCVEDSAIIDITTTSGSTGKPVIFKMTDNDLERLAINEQLSFAGAGITQNDTVLLAVTMDKCFIAGLAYFTGLARLGAALVRVGPTSPDMLLQLAAATNATAIVGVPSYMVRVAEYAKANSFPLETLKIKKLLCIGEPVRNKDFSLNTLGAKLRHFWRCSVYSTYGITELAISFCECANENGGHLHPELLHVEIVDLDGAPVAHGEEGEVVATTFGVTGMPLIRYRTGDISFIVEEKCGCGLSTVRVGPIIGRKQHKLKCKGTSVYPEAIINAIEGIEGIGNYVIIATADLDLSDEVEILLSLNAQVSAQEVKQKLKGALKFTPKITVTGPEAIEMMKSSVSSRKKVSFIDKRGTAAQR